MDNFRAAVTAERTMPWVNTTWQPLAIAQQNMLARRQLHDVGITANDVRNQLNAGRWTERSSTVVSTVTGSLTFSQRCWLGVLHAGPGSLVGGLTAAAARGLQRWDRDEVTVLVGHKRILDPVPGIRFVRTRRPLQAWRATESILPACRLEPAVLLAAACDLSPRAAQGLLAAVVQQRLTTPAQLLMWLRSMTPLHRAPLFREVLGEIADGAQSAGELDVGRVCREHGLPPPARQTVHRDAAGSRRFTDCEWRLPNGRVIVLEVDGGFHMEVEHWEDDIARQRRLTDPLRLVIRCTTRELREDPDSVVADLIRLGVGLACEPHVAP